MTASRSGRSGKWTLGPFVAMTIGQACRTCRAYIPPGTTAYRCPDGEVRCEEHKAGPQPYPGDGPADAPLPPRPPSWRRVHTGPKRVTYRPPDERR